MRLVYYLIFDYIMVQNKEQHNAKTKKLAIKLKKLEHMNLKSLQEDEN